ncbi:recombinase RecT [Methylobacterium sp. WSM2598]|uniref:recombinase RecT n=1 Tax=Methylobacterium sp. WSM2598 TaxID=398261 RepID=UPI0003638B88|nr:recombinase RecT [Methylobacterium sp. WSM2598]
MSTAIAERQERAAHPIVVFNEQLDARMAQFRAALPAHIPPERFKRVVLTAVQTNPELLECDRQSVFNAAVRAAQDGLLPDGREGAMVVRMDYRKGKVANWQVMIAGLRKKVRNSGEIATWDAQVVYENDHFEFELGDDPFIKHRPALTNPGKPIAAYSVATLKSGEKSREVMSIDDVYRIRDRSDGWKAFKANKIKSTPWASDEGEMIRKTVARRHSKVLPMSTDLDDLIRRDDELYDFKGAQDAEQQEQKRPRLAAMLDQIAQRPAYAEQPGESGEAIAAEPEADAQGSDNDEAGDQPGAAQPDPADDFPGNDAIAAGRRSARREG